ncbi:hypothetical protein OG21DRAFT_917467 [Imleria badia]|nr:hypothetical protein OG21DRAFT_917467 [Imleria badia]
MNDADSKSPASDKSPSRDSTSSSSSYSADFDSIENHATPKVKHSSFSTASSQRDLVPAAVPDENRCFLTDRPVALQPCHLVAQETDDETLTKLEYVWEVGYQLLDVETKCNVMQLRIDWLIQFDRSKWMLVPEAKVLHELSKIYLEDRQPTSNLAKRFAKQTFRYYALPAPTLQEPICRYHDLEDLKRHDHDDHFPPFARLGPLTSHIHPHLVVFNSGQKLLHFQDTDVTQMTHFLSQTPSFSADDAALAIRSIQRLYRTWTEVQVPGDFAKEGVSSNRDGA